MKLRTILHTLLLAILCMGCGGHGHMRQLEQLETQLDTAPDAVRLVLDSIPFASLGDEERALYAILRTQADYKCYVPLTTDTLIRHATNYYNRNRKSYRAAMAWYSLGCVYTELRDDVNAIHAYLQAKSFFPDTTTKYHAYCNQNLGGHYMNRNMFDEALTALEAFDKVAISENYDKEIRAASRLDVARIYMHKGLPEMAELTLKDALQESLCIDTRAQIFFELGKIELVFYKNYDEAKEFFNKCTVGSKSVQTSDTYFKAELAKEKGDILEAMTYYEKAMKGDADVYLRYNCIYNLMYLSIDSIQFPLQHAYIRQFEKLNDSIVKIQRQAEILEIENAHTVELKERELKEEKKFLIIKGVACAIILTCGIAITWLLIERKRKAYIKQLQDTLLQNQVELHKLRTGTANHQTDDESLDTLSEFDDSPASTPIANRNAILAIYKNNIDTSIALFKRNGWATLLNKKEITEDKDFIFSSVEREQLYNILFNCFSTVVSNLYDEAKNLNDKEIIHCLLSSLNYSPHIIKACLVASSLNVIRMQKSRIKKKLPTDFYLLLFRN